MTIIRLELDVFNKTQMTYFKPKMLMTLLLPHT